MFFFGRSLPNVFIHPPTPGFLWVLGTQKVNFCSSRICDFYLENSAPTHPCLGEITPKKAFFYRQFFCAFPRFNEEGFFTLLHVIYQLNQTTKNLVKLYLDIWADSTIWNTRVPTIITVIKYFQIYSSWAIKTIWELLPWKIVAMPGFWVHIIWYDMDPQPIP